MKRILAAVALSLFAVPAESKDMAAYMNERTADAVIISRLAERICDNVVVDDGLAKVALEGTGYEWPNKLPQDRVTLFMERFSQRPDDGCRFAWSQYGIGAPGDQNPGLRLLHRSVRNPFLKAD